MLHKTNIKLKPDHYQTYKQLKVHSKPFSRMPPHTHRTTRVSRYQKGKTNLDFTDARDSEWQWHQLGHMQVCTSLQTDNHDSTPALSFLQAGCPSCRPTNERTYARTDGRTTRKYNASRAIYWMNVSILSMITNNNTSVCVINNDYTCI